MNPNERTPPLQTAFKEFHSGQRNSDTLLDFSAVKVTKSNRYCKSLAVKMLEQLANNAARLKYPNIPYLAPRTYKDNSTNELTKCVIDFLRLKGWQAERINSTGRRIDTRTTFEDVTGRTRTIGGSHWIKGTGTNGTADISATIAGRSVKIEVKCTATHDRQSEAQKQYQQAIEKAGGMYVIAKDFAEFNSWYIQNFCKNEKG